MPQVNVRLADGEAKQLDELVDDAESFRTRTDAVRYAVRQLIQREMVRE